MINKKIIHIYIYIFAFQILFLRSSILFAEEVKECYDCHQKEKEAFAKGTVHSPVEDEGCSVCHKDHGDKNNLVLQFEVQKELCFSCHDENDKKNYVHNPIREGKCSTCHNPHNSMNEYLLKDKVPELCLNCHKKDAKERYRHTPYKEGKCLGCHNPHESDNRRLIILDPGKTLNVMSDLCLKCHQKIIQGKNVHLIVLAGECLSCHNPHVSKYEFQLKEPPEKICYQNCHKKFSETRYLHKPVKKGKCVSCHDPHSSPNNKLLLPKEFVGDFNFDKLCYLCHSNMKQKYLIKIHKPVVNGDCGGCHFPHGSENKNLRKFKKDKEMCLSCHRSLKYFTADESGNEKHRFDKLHTKCLKCHNPHGN